MKKSRKAGLLLAVCTILLLPVVSVAFELIELLIQVDLDPAVEAVKLDDREGLINSGYRVANPNSTPITVTAGALIGDAGPQSFTTQPGFALFDRTMIANVAAVDTEEGRAAAVRATFRLDVDARRLRVRFLRDLLIARRLVDNPDPRLELRRARVRARAMDINDVRVMRLVEEGRYSGRWARAVRAIPGRADVRFQPRMTPDGTLGHYGYATDANQDSYVWAVMDRSSQYRVGITLDRDDDGIPNAADNCVSVSNSDQTNSDTDALGNACDPDDDNDGVADENDNCPLHPNADQADFDLDGIGNVCDLGDTDFDGVHDGADRCPGTAAGETVDVDGCSVADLCPCENEWKNHGAYVRCVAHTSESFVADGLLTEEEKDAIVSAGAQSACGFQD